MNEQRQNVVSMGERGEVVTKAQHVYGLPLSGEKTGDGVSQTVERELEVVPERRVRAGREFREKGYSL